MVESKLPSYLLGHSSGRKLGFEHKFIEEVGFD
ncbi:hypothetical protein V6Z12_A13G155800 [Gossypium hirsutum]